MTIKICEYCSGEHEIYCPDCEDLHVCSDCKGLGFTSSEDIYYIYQDKKMKAFCGDKNTINLKYLSSKNSVNWDIVAKRSECELIA